MIMEVDLKTGKMIDSSFQSFEFYLTNDTFAPEYQTWGAIYR